MTMTTNSIDAVIFDIGNVLIEWQPERFYDATIGPDARVVMFAEVDLHGMNDIVDRGAPWRETIVDWAARYPQHKDAIMLWHDRWLDMASPRIDRSVRLLRALRAKGVPIFALTNFGVQTFEYARQSYEFLDEFDRRYISGHMKMIKPEPEIYAAVEADCGIPPNRLLFTDDRPDNIAVAHQRGWQTHLFDGPDRWAVRLVSEGLLTEDEAT